MGTLFCPLPYRSVGPSTHGHPYSLEREREVILAGLTVAHQVAGLFAEPEQVLGICSADGPVVPAEEERGEGGASLLGPSLSRPTHSGCPLQGSQCQEGRKREGVPSWTQTLTPGFPEAVLDLSTPPGGCWVPCLEAWLTWSSQQRAGEVAFPSPPGQVTGSSSLILQTGL